MRPSFFRSLLILLILAMTCLSAVAQIPNEPTTLSGQVSAAIASGQPQGVLLSRLEGLEFVNGSRSQIVLERDGKRYLIDVQSQTIR